MRKPDDLSIAQVERALGEKAEKWVARCYEIAGRIVAAGLVQGVAVYGHWKGPVDRHSHFGSRRNLPFIRHGWIQLDDGRVLDPTRWVFENARPYLYLGSPDDERPCMHCSHPKSRHDPEGFFAHCEDCSCPDYEAERWPYDEGGNTLLEAMKKPPPAFNHEMKAYPFLPILYRKNAAAGMQVKALFGFKGRIPQEQSLDQLFWLANLPYDDFGEHAPAVYENFDLHKLRNLVPIDNWDRAQREKKRKR